MKKAGLISFVLLFVISGQAIGDWWWSNVEVIPQNPTSSDVVVITLSGTWSNSCIPVGSSVSMTGNDIYFDVIAHPPSHCAMVITPWERAESVGPLSPGRYTVYARLVGYPYIPETYIWITEFSVTADSHVDTVYYVDATNGDDNNDGLRPETAFATIQKGIDSAKSGYTIIVAKGVYTGNGNRDIDFKGKAITVRSTDPNDPNIVAATIIDCNGTETDPHRGFYFHNGEDANSVLSGFTITNGYVSVVTSWPCDEGGAIRCENSSPTIINCNITSNKAVTTPAPGWCGIGGGLSCYSSNPTIANCTIRWNSAEHGGGGGIACLDSNPEINNCVITGNTSQYGGGAIHCDKSSPILNNSIIASNSARTSGGINCADHSNPVITNCFISGNSAEIYGGGMGSWYHSRPTLTNCIISANIAGYGSGVFCNESSPIVNNCTVSGNSAYKGGGICSWDSDTIVTNCILWNNVASSGSQLFGSAVFTYCCIQDWSGVGDGNVDADPCFVSPGYWADINDPNIIVEPNDPNAIWIEGDYHLYPFSLCINAGDPDYIPEPNETDLDGNPRIIAGRIDMGAYESNHIHARLWILPRVINRQSRQRRIIAWLRLPGITKDQIDSDIPLLLYPGQIEPTRQFIFQRRRRGPKRTSIIAFFDKAELMEVVPDGRVELHVVGQLKTDRYFHGSDTVRIINHPRRPRRH